MECLVTYLLETWNWIEQLDIQRGVVLWKGAIAVVVDKFDNGVEVVRIGESVLAVAMANFDELVGAAFT